MTSLILPDTVEIFRITVLPAKPGLPPYGNPNRPLTGQRVDPDSPDSTLIRHWAFKMRRTRDLQEVLRCIKLYAEAQPSPE